MSSAYTVAVRMSAADADAEFLRMIVQREEQTGTAMPIDSLIILSRLRNERRLRTTDLVRSVQKPETVVRGTLEKLVEAGMVEAHSTGKGRTYTLSIKVYQGAGEKAAYVRQAGFEPIQQEQMVLNFIDTHGSIKRADTADLCHISPFQATRLLNRLKDKGVILPVGQGKGTRYERS
jgi:ATP-dependent DNA helicase RecG